MQSLSNPRDLAEIFYGKSRNSNLRSDKLLPASAPFLQFTAEFQRQCMVIRLSPKTYMLYEYMLLRAAPCDMPRVKNAHIFGEVIQKGEFWEGKDRVANHFGKSHLPKRSKINWFIRTVKPLEELGLVRKIECGQVGINASYIVYDIREIDISSIPISRKKNGLSS